MPEREGSREVVRLRDDWKFTRGDVPGAARREFDDSAWETVAVPHDWAIRGPFAREHDVQQARVVKDGETRLVEHTGGTGGLPHVGVAWYRRRLPLPEDMGNRRVFIEFDGVMSHSAVFVNGWRAGSWPYGYSSFCLEVTGFLEPRGGNVLAVRVDSPPSASRWYPGAGIYRNVRLIVTAPVHIGHWGTTVTPEIADGKALVTVRTAIRNQSGEARDVELVASILAPDGTEAATGSWCAPVREACTAEHRLAVADPALWDIDTPQLYRVVASLRLNGREVDRQVTPFGIRQLRFDANEGFALNGRRVRLNGVCLHHDLGALGAAVNRRAIERQLEILKDMGCNAIRTSHNPAAPEFLELCDTMGFLVMEEAFDEWRIGKRDNGYHTLFDEWAERDLRAMIRRDRNHPCIILWSIGNEIPEQKQADGVDLARFLTAICHDEDPTRPVTSGFNYSTDAIRLGMAAVVDVQGWNYKLDVYRKYHAEHPGWVACASETESCVSSRGEYSFPVQEGHSLLRERLHVSSYDLWTPVGYSADFEFEAQDQCPSILGQFTWTGFDYLGEPTPYDAEWPSRSSYFGIVDLCGLPKDRYYLYRSRWAADKPTLHLLPHWNWEGREGAITPVHVYTNYGAAELFLNGRSLGVRKKGGDWAPERYRLMWNDVRYEPGTLKIVALDADGRPAMTKEIQTAGRAARIELAPDRPRIAADGEDLCFVTVRVTDERGTVCPMADNRITFEVEGPAEIAAVDNGDQTSVEPFVSERCRAFHGLCVAVLRSRGGRGGRVTLHAVSDALERASVNVECNSEAASERGRDGNAG